MYISIFGFGLIAIIIYECIRNSIGITLLKKCLIITIVCTLNIKMGYFIKVGEFIIGYSTFLLGITALVAICLIAREKYFPRKLVFSNIYFWSILFWGIIYIYIFPYKDNVIRGDWTNYVLGNTIYENIDIYSVQIGYYISFILIGVILLVSKKKLSYTDWKKVASSVINISKLNIIVGYFEFVLKNIFKTKFITDFFIAIFGENGAQQNLLSLRGDFYTIQGATKEASMFATSVFYLLILILIESIGDKNSKKWLIAGGILLLLNPSISSNLYIIILGGIYYIFIKKQNNTIVSNIKSFINGFVIIGISIVLLFYLANNYEMLLNSQNYLIKRVGLSFQQMEIIIKGTGGLFYSSEAIRFSGIYYDLQMILKRPLFGFGLGALNCNSGIVTLITGIGVLGFTGWFNVIKEFCSFGESNLKQVLFLIGILILPNIILNDYETLSCLIIPLEGIMYSFLIKKRIYLEEKYEKSINQCCYVNI